MSHLTAVTEAIAGRQTAWRWVSSDARKHRRPPGQDAYGELTGTIEYDKHRPAGGYLGISH